MGLKFSFGIYIGLNPVGLRKFDFQDVSRTIKLEPNKRKPEGPLFDKNV